MALSEVNIALNKIHNMIQSPGLHFLINQTPWSSYITVRKKFVNKGEIMSNVIGDVVPKNVTATDDLKKQLENKLANAEYDLVTVEEEFKRARQNYEEKVDNLHHKVEILEKKLVDSESNLRMKEAEILACAEENREMDDIISNMNNGFNRKMSELNAKVDELEHFKNETIKKEKKIQKKLNQKTKKEVDKNFNNKPKEESFIDVEVRRSKY